MRQDPELQGWAPAMVETSAGVATFLFTDITSSTRRWEDDRRVMAAALARHDELLRSVVADHGGRVFKHTGDGICATFPTPGAALVAAVTGQRRLLMEPWEAPAPLAVRMAVHVGTAEAREGDFFGPTMNRLARLLELAHGGQVLVSEASRALVAGECAEAVEFLDLGEHRLRDLGRPERVFQVVHPDLPASFPPLRSAPADRDRLPVMPSPFVGRRRELVPIRLLGAAQAIRERTGESFRWPHLGAQHSRCVDRAKSGDASAFAEERARGRQMAAEDALALALAGLQPSGTS